MSFSEPASPGGVVLPPISSKKDGGMLELADTTAKDKNVEESKRKKAKLLKKLKEQESLANANNAVMVRDRRRPRKSIKEMSVLNKRRRVIKNTARKEIAQQKATLESMRHIELKRYSLEARELELFVERVQKVKENKRLTMLFAKFKVSDDLDDSNGSDSGDGQNDSKSASSQDGEQGSDTTTADKKTESMSRLIDELHNMSSMIDTDKNPQWKYMMQSPTKEPAKKEPSERGSPEPSLNDTSVPTLFGSRFRRNQAVEAPAELQTINRFPSIGNGKMSSRDDSEIKGYSGGSIRRCASQPAINNPNNPNNKQFRSRRTSYDIIPSMPTLYSDVELSPKENTAEENKSRSDSGKEEPSRPKPPYHTNWREREKRGDALYSPVALSPIQSGLFSPDFVMEEDELTANYRRKINPKKFQTGMASSTGDMEFNQAMTKMPSGPKKEVAYTGTQSIIEMQLNTKTKHIADKVQKVRNETIKEKKPAQGAKNIAQIIHQSGEGSRFVEEVQLLRQFAALCNCKYLRTDPERLDERRQAYIDTLLENVTKRVQIRNKWKMGIRRVNSLPQPAGGLSLPIISQPATE
ncbi:hypothetical protein ACHWQZ_G015048 [Mnemiopsis leidyi]